MADTTAPVKPSAGAGPEAMAAYTKALDAYTKTQDAKAKAAGAAEKKIAETPYSPVDTTGKAAAPVTRVAPVAPAPFDPVQARIDRMDATRVTDPATLGDAVGGRGGPASVAPIVTQEPEQKIITPTQIGGPKEYAPGEQRTGVENPKYYPETMGNPLQKNEPAKTEKPPASVESVVGKLKAEMNTAGKPNIADFIEAAAAGWNGKKAAYLEKQAKAADVKADIEKLAATAQLEKELQAEKIAADKEIAGIKAMGGVNTVGMRPGQVLGAKFTSQLGG